MKKTKYISEQEIRAQSSQMRVCGKIVRDARKSAGLTQAELSKLSGIRQNRISLIENGKVPLSVSTLEKLARSMKMKLVIQFEPRPKRHKRHKKSQ